MLTPATALLVTLLVLPALRLDWHVLAWTLGTVVGECVDFLQPAQGIRLHDPDL